MLTRTLPVAVVAGMVLGLVPSAAQAPGTSERARVVGEPAPVRTGPPRPLAGVRVALDPGHQLGNGAFGARISRQVRAGTGGFEKDCNTTGTQIDGGLPEATIAWRVVRRVRDRLTHLGARVLLTRHSNSAHRWGPCIDRRGEFGGRVHADLMLSVHADGTLDPAQRGFHVIRPVAGHLVDPAIVAGSLRLARAVRAGLDEHGVPRSNYVGSGTALSPRSDLGTLNLSRVPAVMVELGNVHNRADARLMSSVRGRARYARALVEGIRDYLAR